MKKKSTKKKFKSVKEMDDYLESNDLSSIFEERGELRPSAVKKINLDLPVHILNKIDKIANEIGIARQPLLKLWIHERMKKELDSLTE